MEKIKYEAPEMEITMFEGEDIITLSLGGEGGSGEGPGENWGVLE